MLLPQQPQMNGHLCYRKQKFDPQMKTNDSDYYYWFHFVAVLLDEPVSASSPSGPSPPVPEENLPGLVEQFYESFPHCAITVIHVSDVQTHKIFSVAE